MTFQRLTTNDADFQMLATELERDLKIRDGDEHLFYAELNRMEGCKHALVAYEQYEPIGCGAFQQYSADTVEIKRMYVRPNYRGKGVASKILSELENWSRGSGYSVCILETGKNQPEAIQFYKKRGYDVIPNFGKYSDSQNSVCFKRSLL